MSARTQDILARPTCSISNARDRFHQLVQDPKLALGPFSGLNSTDVNPLDLQNLMECYKSDAGEWATYAYRDPSRGYTRKLVDNGNGKSNRLILVWTPGGSSPIHDHSNAHCVMKVLQGSLKETLYSWPDQSIVRGGIGSPLQTKKQTVYMTNQVTCMSDNLGLHKLSNPDIQEFTVSLHLYTPPNAAKVGCHIYEEQTGKPFHVQQCDFYSELGHKS